MSEYFIGSDGELYHWQLKNHKYIKREKKGNKWVYTYPEEKGGSNKKTSPKNSSRNATKISAGENILGKASSGGYLGREVVPAVKERRAKQEYEKALSVVAEVTTTKNGPIVSETWKYKSGAKDPKNWDDLEKAAKKLDKAQSEVNAAKMRAAVYNKASEEKNAAKRAEAEYYKRREEINNRLDTLKARGNSGSEYVHDNTQKKSFLDTIKNKINGAFDKMDETIKGTIDSVMAKLGHETPADTNPAMVDRGRVVVSDTLRRVLQDVKDVADAIGNIGQAKKKDRAYRPDEDMAAANPLHGTENDNGGRYTDNSLNAVLAYDLRRRGYDVEAMPNNKADDDIEPGVRIVDIYGDPYENDWAAFDAPLYLAESRPGYSHYEYDYEVIRNETKSYIDRLPNDSRCILVNDSGNGSIYTILEKINGNVVVRDIVNNKTYDYDKWIDESKPGNLLFCRTDHILPDNNKAGKRVRNH